MTSEIQFKGLAALSYRMKLLRKLADSDDPITSTVARRLITDRQSRNIGLFYEFILLIILPLVQIALLIVTLVTVPPSFSVGPTGISTPPMMFSLGTTYSIGFISTLAWLAGLILGVLPGLDLVNRDPEGDLLRKVTLTADEILRKLLRLQWVSYAVPQIIGVAITLLINVLESLTRHGYAISMSGTYGFEGLLMGVFEYVWTFMSAVLFGVAGIMMPMLLGRYWPTVAGFIGFQVVATIIVKTPYVVLTALMFTVTGSWFNLYMYSVLATIALYLMLFVVTLKLTRQSIHRRIMPRV